MLSSTNGKSWIVYFLVVKLFSSAGEGGNSLPSFRPFRRDTQADGCPMAEKDCGHSHVHGMKAASSWGGAAYGRKRGSPVSIFQRGSMEKQRAEIRAITKWSFHFHLRGNLIWFHILPQLGGKMSYL